MENNVKLQLGVDLSINLFTTDACLLFIIQDKDIKNKYLSPGEKFKKLRHDCISDLEKTKLGQGGIHTLQSH